MRGIGALSVIYSSSALQTPLEVTSNEEKSTCFHEYGMLQSIIEAIIPSMVVLVYGGLGCENKVLKKK